MIKIENESVNGFEQAIRGMRNPMNSWDKNDFISCADCYNKCLDTNEDGTNKCIDCVGFILGDNNLNLMKNLVKAGTDHRKFMRMIVVYADITAPLYWWKEYDTYKVGTVANSCSTMHKIASKKIVAEDFSIDDEMLGYFVDTIIECERLREEYLNTNDKKYWRALIQLLPSGYNQKRTVMLNYEVLANMYHSRKNHKLSEWRDFCKWIETLQYSELIVGENNEQ